MPLCILDSREHTSRHPEAGVSKTSQASRPAAVSLSSSRSPGSVLRRAGARRQTCRFKVLGFLLRATGSTHLKANAIHRQMPCPCFESSACGRWQVLSTCTRDRLVMLYWGDVDVAEGHQDQSSSTEHRSIFILKKFFAASKPNSER